MLNHMMTCRIDAKILFYNLDSNIKWGTKYLVQLFGTNPIFILVATFFINYQVIREVTHNA